jgi:hypothetical protein
MMFAGVTASVTNVAEFTVRVANPLTPPKLALMFAVPADTAVADTTAPPPLPTVATAGLFEFQ